MIFQGTQAQLDAVDEKALHSGFSDILELLAYTINKISCEVIHIITILNIVQFLIILHISILL